MKFTRTLSLALAAAAALSMTACDDSTSSTTAPEGFNFDSYVTIGAQGNAAPSFASLRLKDSTGALVLYTGSNTNASNYYGKHLSNVDMIFFADSLNSNELSFISPKLYKTGYNRLAAASSADVLNATEFIWVGNSESGDGQAAYTQITAEDVTDYADNGGFLTKVSVAKGDNFVAKITPAGTSTTYLAVIHVENVDGTGRAASLDVKVKAKL